MALFNRLLLGQNRNRVVNKFLDANFIHLEIAEIITQTIIDCKRNFANILEIGSRNGDLGKRIADEKKSTVLIQTDCSSQMVYNHNLNLVMDDEILCFKEQSFDLILSNLNLHLVNDIPRNLVSIKNLLKSGGFFITSFFGEENLKELREVFFQTEQKFYGGISPRIAPLIDIKTAGMMLGKAGFVDVVAEKHRFLVEYSNPKKLLVDLKNMGEANILNDRSQKFITKNFLFNLTELYKNLYSVADSSLTDQENVGLLEKNTLATFEIIILAGWKQQ